MDDDAELAELEAAVYSRAGSAESVVDFIDPVTGETVRATPSQLRLRALRARRAERTAGLGARDAEREASPTQTGLPPRRRFVVPLVAAAAFAAGIATVLIVTSALAPISVPGTPVVSAIPEPLLIFDFPSLSPDIPLPDLGDQFVAASIRSVAGLSPIKQGFGVYVGRETGSGLYCLIVHTAEGATAFSCATADDVARRGLSVGTDVTVRSPITADGALGRNEVAAELSTRGEFSMSLARTLQPSIDPPATTGTPLGTWTNGPDADGDFQGAFNTNGEVLIVAMDCRGEGTVTVELDGEPSVFHCRPDRIESFLNEQSAAPVDLDVRVTTQGNVIWGLTIASTPVTGSAED